MFFNVVEHLDPTGKTIVARIPPQGSGDFNTGSQLVVQESQVAVFYRDGRMCDQFRAGRYTLSTQNIPILRSILKLGFRGKSPFRAYVYFVNLKNFIDLGWGTPNRILYRDQNFKMGVNLGAFGTYSMRVTDHVRFLNTIVGTQGLQSTESVEEYLRKLIAARFANVLAKIQTSVYDLPGRYDAIGAALKDAVRADFNQYGLELIDMAVVNISLPDEVMAMIDRRSRLDMYDEADVAKAQGLAVADALPTAAANPGGAGTGVGAGIGFGAGIAMGNIMAGQIAKGQQAGPPPPPGAAWYVYVGGKQVGPMTVEQLAGAIQAGQVEAGTMVWRQGLSGWTAANQVAELTQLFAQGPPPPPPPPPSPEE